MNKSNFFVYSIIPLLLLGMVFAFDDAKALKSQGVSVSKYGSATSGIVCGDRLCSENAEKLTIYESSKMQTEKGLFASTLKYTKEPPIIDPEKGYAVTEIGDGLYWLIGGGYQMMFLTTGQGVIAVDAPPHQLEKKF